ncbi:hypothetical protein GQ61_07765 [Candidatus Nucleicultrix amoebiphila FS5]|uniref:Uncharacterized protein n=1 Tax=Candidatus Nucleicultrix amoebiphila FS5 TaxID=1414854 RepID=A0A1W6N5N9_9PROT|nr:hypothetical protein GQ61_07765 [Candidatus Nucleicultrix amoebiphila FS5]
MQILHATFWCFLFFVLYIPSALSSSGFRYHDTPFEQTESESSNEYKLRCKIHHVLETLADRERAKRRRENPSYDPYTEESIEESQVTWKAWSELDVATDLNDLLNSIRKFKVAETLKTIDNFSQQYAIYWWIRSGDQQEWQLKATEILASRKSKFVENIHGFYEIKDDEDTIIAVFKPRLNDEPNDYANKRSVDREELYYQLAEAAGLHTVVAPAARIFTSIAGQSPIIRYKHLSGTLEKYIALKPKDYEENGTSVLKLFFQKARQMIPFQNPPYGNTLSFENAFRAIQLLTEPELANAFLKSFDQEHISLHFLTWYLLYHRDLHNSNCQITLISDTQSKLIQIDTEHSLTESVSMRAHEPVNPNWTTLPFFLYLPHIDSPLTTHAIEIVKGWSAERFLSIIKLSQTAFSKDDIESLKTRLFNIKDLLNNTEHETSTMRELYQKLTEMHPHQQWDVPSKN